MGGSDIYCIICGGPPLNRSIINNTNLLKKVLKNNPDVTDWERPENLIEDDIKNISKSEIKALTDSIKILSRHDWLNNFIALLPNNKTIPVTYDGDFFIDKKGVEYSADEADSYYMKTGIFMHKNCYQLMKKYKEINFNEIKSKINLNFFINMDYGIIKKYQHQFFQQILAYLENPYLLENPLKNLKNKDRILSLNHPISKTKTIKSKKKSIRKISRKLSRKKSKKKSRKKSKKKSKKKSRKKSKKSHRTKSKKIRPSPSESATLFSVDTTKRGNDGNTWIIIQTKSGVNRWKKL